jgi:hypothetical protein
VIVPQTSGAAQLVAMDEQAAPRKSGLPAIAIVAICCGVFVVCGSILAFLFLPAIMRVPDAARQAAREAAREAGRRASCMNKLKQIDLALLNYQSTYGHFPPAATTDGNGKPLMSWRVAILPFMGQDALYHQYDPNQPWNSPKNLAVAKQTMNEFRCPSDGDVADGQTSYVMITGKNTIGGVPGSPGTGLGQITGGLPKTIIVLEVQGLKIPWAEPRDITLDELVAKLRSGHVSGHPSVFNVGMADGSVHPLPLNIDPEKLRRLAEINGQKPLQIEDF